MIQQQYKYADNDALTAALGAYYLTEDLSEEKYNIVEFRKMSPFL